MKCKTSTGDRDIFEWYGVERVDQIPRLVLSKFLKLCYELHETQGTLDLRDPNMDGMLDICDRGVVITHLHLASLQRIKQGGQTLTAKQQRTAWG
jgi:hypothetical protein